MNIVKFIWRNLIAEYDLDSKEFIFHSHELYISMLEDYKEDVIKFKDWIIECARHKEGYKATVYGTGEVITAKPYNVEIY